MFFQTVKKFNECLDFSNKNINQSIVGFSIGEKSFFAGCVDSGIIVVADFLQATAYKAQLTSMGKSAEVIVGTIDSPVFVYSQDLSQVQNFVVGVSKFAKGLLDFLIVMPDAICQRLKNIQNFMPIKIEKGQNINFEELSKNLQRMGYKKRDIVLSEGEYRISGDIFDIFVVSNQHPHRINFFGDEIESINTFSVEDMTQIEKTQDFYIFPNTIYFRESAYEVIDKIQDYQKSLSIKGEKGLKIDENIQNVIHAILRDENSLNLAFTTCFEDNFDNNILSLFKNKKIFIDEPRKILQVLDLLYSSQLNLTAKYIDDGLLLPKHYEYFIEKEKLFPKEIKATTFTLQESQQQILEPEKITIFSCYVSKKYCMNYKILISDINQFLQSKQKIILFAGDIFSKEKLQQFLIENDIFPKEQTLVDTLCQGVFVLDSELAFSVEIAETNTILIGTNDLIKRSTKVSSVKHKNVFYLPKVNDYVVHEFHGIGKCVAIERLKLANFEKDYFVLEYAKGDKVYIPTEQVDTISAYVGGESSPKLNKIGGIEFALLKAKAKKAIEEFALNLVELYKSRQNAKGFVFEADNYLQQAFEDTFEYDETTDQLQAINDAKNDMMSTKIMDRLVCGDVGYGKTEVALRCAYKAMLSGKQVAFLCPTTILSQQHFKTCQKRFKDFMINVAVLNRLVPQKEQTKIVSQVSSGKIDIIIGTHRLLGKDIKFADLGLLILDEEQRFGVQDKERIKEIKKNVDVLTLSATPIPRTLHMSLSGIRDISIIETAPKNRLPVQTFVCEYDEAIIESAINRELARNGQVYIVYNKVETIMDFLRYIQSLFPNISIGVAHGQMDRKTLENAVLKLYGGFYQILISTTLIENGIDIPTANTLIVIDADKLGLSSLYQLKGRVGRSGRIAYAYFTYKKNKVLTEQAMARLNAISEFSSLGSGFKIAMRDLEIRGAGSVLGNKQHGHIEKIGYDLYCKLLDETINQIKGEKQKEKKEIKIDININAFIPVEYIQSEDERIKMYSNITLIESSDAKSEFEKNSTMTYGKVPREVINLINIALIKNICLKNDVKSVIINKDKCQLVLYKKKEVLSEYLAKKLEKFKQYASLKLDELPIINFKKVFNDLENQTEFVLKFLV